MEDERPKRSRASNKPARYQQDDDDDVSPPVKNNKNGSSNSNKKAPNNIDNDNNETTPSEETAVASTKTSSRRRASNKPARYSQDDDDDKVPSAAGSSSNTKKKAQSNQSDNGGKKKTPSSKAVASAKTSSSLGGEEEPTKKTARIKIRLSVGAKKGGGGEKGGGSVASKSSSTRGKKRKAEDVDEKESSLEGKQQVKVRVRVNDKPCKEGVCYAQLPSLAANMEVKETDVKKKGNGGGRKGKRKKEEEEMEESSDDDQVDEIDEDDIVEDDEDEDMDTSNGGGGAFTSAKLKQPWRLCKVPSCNMYKKARSDGYCLTHWREYNPDMDPPSGEEGFSRTSSSTQLNAGKGCKVSGCTNNKSPKKDGYCASCWLAYQPADDVGGEKREEESNEDDGGGGKEKTSSDLSEKKDEEMKNVSDEPQDSLAQDSAPSAAPSAVASSPATSSTPKVVLVVEHLVLNSNVSLQELRGSTRDAVKTIVNKANILFGNQFWQDIKSLLLRAIDAAENGEKVDHNSLMQMYASSNHSAPISYAKPKPKPKPVTAAKPPPIEEPASSSIKKQTKSKKNLCKWPDCTRVIQTNCKGYCLTHVNYINYEENDVTDVTKVRVRINTRLENGFCRAILPIKLREKWGFPQGPPPEGRMSNAGNEIDMDVKMKTDEMEEEDDTKPPAAGGDEMEVDEPMPNEKDTHVDGPASNQIDSVFQNEEVVKQLYECPFPGCPKTNLTRNGIAAHYGMKHGGTVDILTCRVVGSRVTSVKKKPAVSAASMDIDNEDNMPQIQGNNDAPLKPIEIDLSSIDLQAVLDFEISLTTIKKSSGAAKCRAINCPKNQQGNAGGFCRAHHNRYLICTGQCGSWVCKCGNKVADIQTRCGTCHRWKDGKHSMSSGNTPSKADQFRSSMVKGNIADSMFVVDPEDDEDYDAAVNDGEDWTCDNCGKIVPGKKSRCGNCHRWRGGKRRGGWKLGKPMGRDDDSDDGIDRTQDWTCCGEILPAEKTRCGKCNGWRGGKRIAAKEVDWNCAKCGITNDGGSRRCGGCLTWKTATKTTSKSSNRESSNGNLDGAGGHWRCKNTKCNFDNFASELFCFNCQAARPHYEWHKKQQLTSGVGGTQAAASKGGGYPVQAAGKMASQVSATVAQARSAVTTQPATAIPSVISVPSQGASAAVSMEQPDIRVRVDTAEGSDIVPINYPPDNLNYYGSIHEGLGYPYISLHYDFNRAYYHNCQYNYLYAGLAADRASGSSQNGENKNTDDNENDSSSSPSGSTNKDTGNSPGSDDDDKDEDLSDDDGEKNAGCNDNGDSVESDAEKKSTSS